MRYREKEDFMISVLKTILIRLEKIEKQLGSYDGGESKRVEIIPTNTAIGKSTVADAETEVRRIIIEAKDEAFRLKREAEEEARKARQEMQMLEQKLVSREEASDKRVLILDEREHHIREQEDAVQKRLSEIDKLRSDLIGKLEKAAKLTRDEAKSLILTAVEDKSKEEIAKRIKEAEVVIKQESEKRARDIIIDAMRHGATDYVAEYTVSTIKIADEDFKGRIIGKEGRNIRAFEMETGVDVDLDEEGVIRLSSFDPVRRDIARVSLERLLRDGRVQPGRIEELVEQVKKEIERIMLEEGPKL